MSATITWRCHVGFSYHASSGTCSEFAMTSGLPSLLKSATETLYPPRNAASMSWATNSTGPAGPAARGATANAAVTVIARTSAGFESMSDSNRVQEVQEVQGGSRGSGRFKRFDEPFEA